MAKRADNRIAEAMQKISDLKEKVATYTTAHAKSQGNADLHMQMTRAKRSLDEAEQELVDLKAKIARETFDERIASLQRDVASMEESMSEVALAMTEDPTSKALEEQLADIRRQRDSRLQAIENMQMARTAASRRDVEAEAAAKDRQLADLQERHAAAWKRAIRQAVQLVDHLATAGPQWMATLSSLAEANAIGREMISLARGDKARSQLFNRYNADGLGHIASALVSALASTRIGIEGPALHGVTVPYLGPKDLVSASDLEQRLGQVFEMQHEAGSGPEPERPPATPFVRPPGARQNRISQWPLVAPAPGSVGKKPAYLADAAPRAEVHQ